MEPVDACGSIPDIVLNSEKLYEGDLSFYFKMICKNARNLTNPYHNFSHMFNVTWLCYQACIFYKDMLTPVEMRILLISAMWHDFNHSGKMGDDYLNIEQAVEGVKNYITPEDRKYLATICEIIKATEFPHKIPSKSLPLLMQIIRDANVAQAFSTTWIQQVIFGLSKEWNKDPTEILAAQCPFLSNLDFSTEWAQQRYPERVVKAKIAEANALLKLMRGIA